MMLELEEAYGMFDVDDRVKCIIVTGTGKIFCAGADLVDGFKGGVEPVNEHRDGYVCTSPVRSSPALRHQLGCTRKRSRT